MEKDDRWKQYFSDNHRYADIINGIGCGGMQLVKASDLSEADTGAGKKRARDLLRKTALGLNFVLIGIENQETIDYAMPFRVLGYDMSQYETQISKIKKEVKKGKKDLSPGEYLYGYQKENRLNPVATFILYSGETEWDGPHSLHEMLDFTDVPKHLKSMISDYKINVIEIRKLEHTEVFQTDVRQVFDFIRCSEDKEALKQLVESDCRYQNMEEDAFEIVALYTNAEEIMQVKENWRKDGKINMCTAIKELIAEGRDEGISIGRNEGIAIGKREGENLLAVLISKLLSDERIGDVNLAANDENVRQQLYREYGLIEK